MALDAASVAGAQTHDVTAQGLVLEPYVARSTTRSESAERFVSVFGSGRLSVNGTEHHGAIVWLLRNVLSYVEEMARDEPVRLSEMQVGGITSAHGNYAADGGVGSLGDIVDSLRAIATPYGAAIVSDSRDWLTDQVAESLMLGEQRPRFASSTRSAWRG